MTCARQLNALMRKNFIYNKRHYIISFIEFFFPILLVLILTIIRQYIDYRVYKPEDTEEIIKDYSTSIVDSSYPEGGWYGIHAFIQ
jgi:hypothetical protein